MIDDLTAYRAAALNALIQLKFGKKDASVLNLGRGGISEAQMKSTSELANAFALAMLEASNN